MFLFNCRKKDQREKQDFFITFLEKKVRSAADEGKGPDILFTRGRVPRKSSEPNILLDFAKNCEKTQVFIVATKFFLQPALQTKHF